MKTRLSLIFLMLLLLAAVPAHAAENDVIGACESLMQAMSDPPATVAETSLGSLTADAVRAAVGSDIAVVTADEFSANLQPGDVTGADVAAALPYDRPYVLVTVTAGELTAFLEDAFSHICLTDSGAIDKEASASGAFPQISGFTVRYDPNLPAGQRVQTLVIQGLEVPVDDGEQLFSLVLPEHRFDSAIFTGEPQPAGVTAASALTAYIGELGSVPLPSDGRIHPIAVRDNDIINTFPVVGVAFCIIVIVVCGKFLISMASANRRG